MEVFTKESALNRITELVNIFDEHYETYHRANYDEAKTRGTFIDEFFEALGWDIHNKEGVDESYRDVIPEDKIKIGGRTKAPDYCFTIRGQKKFFVEAKKPAIPIKTDSHSVIQLRNYGYHHKLPISIITNFEEFAIYDCTIKPKQSDKPNVGRIRYFTYKEYIKEFDFIWNTFSKESVLKGRYDKFVKSDTEKRGTSTVDSNFLDSLNEWRNIFAKNIAKKNQHLTQEEIQYAVQQTINRIIFLIFCEYKSIEPFGNLKRTTDKGNIYHHLLEIFYTADQKYNSGLFNFSKDNLSEKLIIDNDILKKVILDLYPPNSEYDFSIFPVEVLGDAYEQFLGKTIRITPGHNVKIEDKPEVKKAGGVYYTPQYIVDYIVKNTVGKIIQGKTPEQISKIKIVDPSCGSGSFLLGAFQFLLNYHTDYYLKKGFADKKIKNNPITPERRLSTDIKRKILINNIFGVDIDPQAVEVTKLSLLLKAMEGETEASINRQLKLLQERVLPNIDGNIKCGNSLIGHDFLDTQLDLYKNEKDYLKKKINPFDWRAGFPQAFKEGGFDVVIGNPPWVSLNGKFGNQILSEDALQYLIQKYHGNTYRPNLYEYFVHKGLEIVKPNGYFSFIVPDRLGFNEQFISLRKKILENYTIEELLYKAEFPNIVTDTLIFRIRNKKSKSYEIKVGEFGKEMQTKASDDYWTDNEHKFSYESSDVVGKILDKIFNIKKCKSLGGKLGIIESKTGVILDTSLVTEEKSNQKQIKITKGRNVEKYYLNGCFYCEFSNRSIKGGTNDKKKLGVKEKILLRKTGYPIFATYDDSGIYPEQSLYFLFNNKTSLSLKYFTALINSKLFQFVYWHRLVTNRDSTPQLKKTDLDRFPVFIPDLQKKEEKSAYDEIVKQVDKLLKLHEELHKTKTPAQHQQIQNQILYAENRIDELVFYLYNLSKKDIETIKNNLP